MVEAALIEVAPRGKRAIETVLIYVSVMERYYGAPTARNPYTRSSKRLKSWCAQYWLR